MLKLANQQLTQQEAWISARHATVDTALARLDADFDKLLKTGD
jgi:hypothetical protein